MRCPSVTDFQSPAKGQKRLDQAIDSLGNDVVNKILGFSLYILGFPYDYISSNVGFSEPGLKTFIKDVCQNGVQRFLDKRKKAAYSIPQKDFPVAAPPKTQRFWVKPIQALIFEKSSKIFVQFYWIFASSPEFVGQV